MKARSPARSSGRAVPCAPSYAGPCPHGCSLTAAGDASLTTSASPPPFPLPLPLPLLAVSRLTLATGTGVPLLVRSWAPQSRM